MKFRIRFVLQDQRKTIEFDPTSSKHGIRGGKARDLVRVALREWTLEALSPFAAELRRMSLPSSTDSQQKSSSGEHEPFLKNDQNADRKTALKLITPAQDSLDESVDQMGLYCPARGHWLDNNKPILEYELSRDEELELQCFRHFIATIPHADQHYAEGSLLKKGERSIVWKHRIFVLRNFQISWWKQKGDPKPIGTLDLSAGFELVQRAENYCFDLQTADKQYRLKAENMENFQYWIRILKSIEAELQSNETMIFDQSSIDSRRKQRDLCSFNSEISDPDYSWPSDVTDEDTESTHGTYLPSLLETFGHLKLTDAMKKLKRSSLMCTEGSQSSLSESLPSSCSNNIDISGDKIGYLYKKGNSRTTGHSLRYRLFILRDKLLSYYKPTREFLGLINLEGSRIYSDQKSGKKSFIFRIVTPSRVYVLSTPDRNEWQDWRDAFESVCGLSVIPANPNANTSRLRSRSSPSINNPSCIGSLARSYNRDSVVIYSSDNECGGPPADVVTPPTGPLLTPPHSHSSSLKPHHIHLEFDFKVLGEPILIGILWKQGNDRWKKWRRRRFLLVGRTLFYTTMRQPNRPIGSIPLNVCRLIKPVEDSPSSIPSSDAGDYRFDMAVIQDQSLSCPGVASSLPHNSIDLPSFDSKEPCKVIRCYHLRAQTASEYQRWIETLGVHLGLDSEQLHEFF